MEKFDIIKYLSNLTAFGFDRGVYENIALQRNVYYVESYDELSQEQIDLCHADILFVAYLSPTQSASYSEKHGSYSRSVGAQTISDKASIYDTMISLYKKWNDSKVETIEASSPTKVTISDATMGGW